MTMIFKKILVAFDGSEQSQHAIDAAAEMANTNKGKLVVLTVVPKVSLPIFPDEGFGNAPVATPADWADYQDKMNASYKKSQDDAMKGLKEHYPKLATEAILLEGRPSAKIVEQAEKNQADLIVMGSRGIGGISGWILGSTSRRVVESCTKPVLIMK
ncbi:TPA: universal stress protein [Candidatus Bathyarchaeota archaeon]|nr:universal stress protein [Candidatus Bathyarchaeota archaeon]